MCACAGATKKEKKTCLAKKWMADVPPQTKIKSPFCGTCHVWVFFQVWAFLGSEFYVEGKIPHRGPPDTSRSVRSSALHWRAGKRSGQVPALAVPGTHNHVARRNGRRWCCVQCRLSVDVASDRAHVRWDMPWLVCRGLVSTIAAQTKPRNLRFRHSQAPHT